MPIVPGRGEGAAGPGGQPDQELFAAALRLASVEPNERNVPTWSIRYSLAPSGLAGVLNSHLTASGSTLMMWRPEWQPLPHSRWQA